ncbi:MAG TPA: hypothetical protein VGR10_06025 [Thermoleophilaceae bacterium]|nr:hypothetical protein [Thermoleophilaceae bacterium]
MSAKTKIGRGGLQAARVLPAKDSAAKFGGRLAMRSGRTGVRAYSGLPAKGKAKAAKGGARAGRRAAMSNAYVYAVMHDERLHAQLADAYHSLVKAYDRISSQDDLAHALLEDTRTRRHLARTNESLRAAAQTVGSAKDRRRRRRGVRTLALVGLAGGMVAVAVNEDLRSKLLGALTGSDSGGDPSSGGGGSNGVVPAAAVENAPPTTTSSS